MLHVGTWAASIFLLMGAILFLLLAVINRQLNNFGMSFNPLFSYVGGIGVYVLIGWFLSVKYGLFIGFVAGIILGFVGAGMYGGDDDG